MHHVTPFCTGIRHEGLRWVDVARRSVYLGRIFVIFDRVFVIFLLLHLRDVGTALSFDTSREADR
jgi:hypothetical protein